MRPHLGATPSPHLFNRLNQLYRLQLNPTRTALPIGAPGSGGLRVWPALSRMVPSIGLASAATPNLDLAMGQRGKTWATAPVRCALTLRSPLHALHRIFELRTGVRWL